VVDRWDDSAQIWSFLVTRLSQIACRTINAALSICV
jgi:hypothetical protein